MAVRAWLAALLFAGMLSVLAGCNTARGFTKDLEALGQRLSDSPSEAETQQNPYK